MNAAYHLAAIPEPYRILGLTLRPFSIGHHLLMQRFECAFVAEKETKAGANDLILGVLICSMQYQEFLDLIESRQLAPALARWRKKIMPFSFLGVMPFLGRWWRRHYAFNVVEKMQLFSSYLKAGMKVPLYWEEEGCESSAAHWTQCVLNVLCGQLGYDYNHAVNMPMTQAFEDYFRYAESHKIIRLMTEDEIAQTEQLKEARCPA